MATIENVNDRTILQQFHELYKKQNETETNVENLNTKIDQETSDRQSADLTINTEIQALKDQIDSLGVLFTYKGEVATIQNLPVTNNKPGDVYYVDSEQSEYIWIEKNGVYQWEQFGPAIDLSEYAKQEDLQQLKNEVDAMNTQVESNSSNIVSLTNTKQNKLTAGTNITIDENNVISSGNADVYIHKIFETYTGSGLYFTSSKSTPYTYEEFAKLLYDLGCNDPTLYNGLFNVMYKLTTITNGIKYTSGWYSTNGTSISRSDKSITFAIDNGNITTSSQTTNTSISSSYFVDRCIKL